MKHFYLFILLIVFGQVSRSQCPAGTVPSGVNLVVNGDFSAGNTGFSSSYQVGSPGIYGLVSNAGQYAVVSSPTVAHAQFTNFGDHTTGTGQMLVVNGSGNPNTNVWCQTISIQPNTYYNFSAWATSAVASSPAILQFSINGVNLGSPFSAPSAVGVWQQFFITWFSGTNTSANICIVNQNTSSIGNDFAIDDITFVECVCNLNVNAGPDTTVCEGSSVQLFATGGDSYQWYPFTGLTDSSIANPVATVTSNTTFYAIISNVVGCIDTASVTINVIPQQQINAGTNDSICFGDSIQLNATGTGTVSWFPTTSLSNSNILNPIASPTQTTDYILTITDGPCVYYDTVTIFVKQLPQIDGGVNDSVCIGSSIQLNGSGNGIVSWFPSAGLSNANILNPVATPSQTTKYYLTIQSNGCINTDSVTIFVKQLPLVSAGTDLDVCIGSSIQLSGTGNGIINWSPSTDLNYSGILNPLASPLQTTSYILNITANGCENQDTVVVSVKPLPQVDAGINDSICFGESIQINGNGSGIVSWAPATTLSNSSILNPVATPLQTTSYILQIDSAGCTNSDSVAIFIKQLPQLDAGINDSVCIGSSIQLNGTGNGIVSWSPATGLTNPNILNPVASPTQTIKYYLTIQSNGCQNTDSVNVFVKQLPLVSAGADKIICDGDSIQLNGNGNGLASWTPSPGLNNTNILNPVASPVQSISYVLTITANGCENKDTVVVSVKPLPYVNAGINDSICLGESVQLNGNGSGTVLWNPSINLNNNSVLNPVATPLQTTSYILQIDSAGCSNTDTVLIFVKSLPFVSAGVDDTICAGESAQLNGSGSGNVFWSPTQSLNNNSFLNPVATPTQTTVYILTIEENSCYNKDSVTIYVKQLPIVNAGIDSGICEGSSIQLSGSGQGIISWFPDTGMNNSTILNPVVSPTETTFYILTVVSNGCENSDSVKITVISLPQVDAGEDKIVCEGASIQLSAAGASSYIWSPAINLLNENTANPVATPLETTEYIVTGILNGCTNYDTVIVNVVPLPLVNAGNDTIVPKETYYKLTGYPSNGNWSSDDGVLCTTCTSYNLAIMKDQPFYYAYSDSNGCENTDTVFIYLNKTCKDPYLPTAFSPNDDLLNDIFKPVFEDIHVVLDAELLIYNKWGEQVFYSNKINDSWDGLTNGMIQSIGVYAYILKYSCETDTKVIKGTFTLVR